jgi:hypothetical protein
LESGFNIKESWDTNAITPGTIFMKNLSEAIKKNIHQYKNIKCNMLRAYDTSNVCMTPQTGVRHSKFVKCVTCVRHKKGKRHSKHDIKTYKVLCVYDNKTCVRYSKHDTKGYKACYVCATLRHSKHDNKIYTDI